MCRNAINFLYNSGHITLSCLQVVLVTYVRVIEIVPAVLRTFMWQLDHVIVKYIVHDITYNLFLKSYPNKLLFIFSCLSYINYQSVWAVADLNHYVHESLS